MSKAEGTTRRALQALWWIGLGLAIGGTAAALAGVARSVSLVIVGAGFVALGLNASIAGDWLVGPPPRFFIARGQVVRGVMEIKAGWTDVVVAQGPSDRVATVSYGPFGQPDFEFAEGVAHLRLSRLRLAAHWQANLANNVLWDIRAHSLIGDLMFDLRTLRIEQVEVHCGPGPLTIHCPERGFSRILCHTTLGRIEIHVPPRVGVRLQFKADGLSTMSIDLPRLQQIGTHEYATEGHQAAETAVDLTISATAGEVHISGA